MSATLTATADPSNLPPRVLLEVAGMAGASVTITRTDGSGNSAPVRTANPADLTSTDFTGYDYEAPFGVDVTYAAVSNTADTATSATVNVAVTRPWLLHPGVPALSVPVRVASFGDRTMDTAAQPHVVLGRATPIVISDGVRHSPTFDTVLRTESLAEETALGFLLEDTSVLLMQAVSPTTARRRYEWVSVGPVVTTNLIDYFGNETVHWSLPCTVASAPAGLLQSQRTYSDLLADFADYTALDAAYATYHDLLIG